MTGNGTRVGVLALQGAFAEHLKALKRLKLSGTEVRRAADLEGLSGLIIPGGESTTIGRLMAEMSMREPILRRVAEGMAVMGTCAGMILLAGETSDYPLEPLGLMDITVRRNAFGRQVDSFETPVAMAALGATPFPAVFIRAPCIEKAGTAVEALGRLNDGRLVAARQGKLLALAFHPELTRDTRCHALFVGML